MNRRLPGLSYAIAFTVTMHVRIHMSAYRHLTSASALPVHVSSWHRPDDLADAAKLVRLVLTRRSGFRDVLAATAGDPPSGHTSPRKARADILM